MGKGRRDADQPDSPKVNAAVRLAVDDLRRVLQAVTEVVVSLDQIASSPVPDAQKYWEEWKYLSHDGGAGWLKLTEVRRVLNEAALATFSPDEVDAWAASWKYWGDDPSSPNTLVERG